MYKLFMSGILTFSLSMILMILCLMISKKTINDREKMSPFECGFEPKSSPRSPFSSQFFLIAVLFMIFDIEIVVILPMILTLKLTSMSTWMSTSIIIILILMLGLFYEWKDGVLEWAK